MALSFIAHYWALGAVLVTVAWLIRNRYYNGLNEYPGPFIASLTDIWRLYEVWGRQFEVTHRKLHAQHGDVVRLGPNTLSFADPKALKTIYGLNKGFVKVRDFSSPELITTPRGPYKLTKNYFSQISTLSSKGFRKDAVLRRSSARRTMPSTRSSDAA